ncbi:MAG: rhodanese-like domain-containing protein [Ignavibacteriae bacterium]|nr:rhodanese-like domain-containing protein [Ignavibacteriota bacterium]
MEQLRKLFYLLLILPFLFVNTGCSSDDDNPVDPPVEVNQAEVLATALEADGVLEDYPALITAVDVNTAILASANIYVIDIRSTDVFNAGHIKDAVNVPDPSNVLQHYRDNNLETKETVVIACYSGQTAAWATGLLRAAGYTNVKDLKWGMCSWNAATSGSWTSQTNVNNGRATELVTTATARPAAGDLPTLNTGSTEAAGILENRLSVVAAEGFGAAKVSSDEVFNNLSNYFILNYWSVDHYNWGHIPGAVQYTPKADIKLATALKTLPTDKPIAVYCYTGHTSAHVAAYLRALGYDAKSVLFGVNGMAHDTMPASKFDPATQINDFPLFQ